MLQGKALEIILNLAKQRMETLPEGEVMVGKKQKGVKEVWGEHYQEAIREVESLLKSFEDDQCPSGFWDEHDTTSENGGV